MRIYDVNRSSADTFYYGASECPCPTAANIFRSLEHLFEEDGISWDNVVALASDGCNVMRGKHNSVLTCVMAKQPNAFSIHCPCHVVHLCASAAASKLPGDLEQFLRHVVYHIEHRPKRRAALLDFQAQNKLYNTS